VGSLVGGGSNNQSWTASGANILNPTTVTQANSAYGTAQGALTGQQQLASALQGQTTQGAAEQTSLAQALAQQAAGGGPNPAQAQLAQNTSTNVANQAALMAGQRGASGNVGLMARQAAQQGAATQQQAVGQAATLQAQQQLAAQQQLQSLAASQVGQGTSAANSYSAAAQNEQGNILSSINAQNNANVAQQSNENSTNSGMAQTNANNSAGAVGGLINSAGGAAASLASFAKGGMVGDDPAPNKKLAKVAKKDRLPLPDHIKGMAAIFHPKHFADGGEVTNIGSPQDMSPNSGPIANSSPLKSQAQWKVGGGKPAPAGASSGGSQLVSGLAGDGGSGGMASAATLLASDGAVVPGKAKVKGNSEKNDTVPAMLSAGEIVLPRSVTQSDDPVANSAKFVAALLEKHGKSLGKEESDFKEALKKAIKSRKK
jgi:hypothetical protein